MGRLGHRHRVHRSVLSRERDEPRWGMTNALDAGVTDRADLTPTDHVSGVGAIKGGRRKTGVGQIRPLEIRPTEIGGDQLNPSQIGALKIGASQIGVGRFCPLQAAARELGVGERDVLEPRIVEVDAGQRDAVAQQIGQRLDATAATSFTVRSVDDPPRLIMAVDDGALRGDRVGSVSFPAVLPELIRTE